MSDCEKYILGGGGSGGAIGDLTGATEGRIPFGETGGGGLEDNANLFYDEANVRVGIGTSSPASPLHVFEDTTTTGVAAGITIEQDGIGDAIIQFLETAGQRWVAGLDNSDQNKFKISSTEDLVNDSRFTIDTLGRVGVGLTSPSARFHVLVADTENVVAMKITNNDSTNDTAFLEIAGTSDGQALLLNTGTGSLANGIAFGDGDTAIFESVDDILDFAFEGTVRWQMFAATIQSAVTGGAKLQRASASSTVPAHTFTNDTNTGMGFAAADQLSLISGGVEGIRITEDTEIVIDMFGAMNWKRNSTAVSVNSNQETIIGVTDNSSARTITLDTDDVVDGRVIIIKDEAGTANSANNITIATEGAETIDGAATITISVDFGAARLYSDGTNWFTF